MTRKDYIILADVIGQAFATADSDRELVYNAVYIPLCAALAKDNDRFDQHRFSHACAVAEGKYLAA